MSSIAKALENIISAQQAGAEHIGQKQLQRQLAKEFRASMKGDKGDKGDMGNKPIAGIDFPMPKSGKDGKDGETGATGKSGSAGAKGERGEKGTDGKDGIDGRDGKDAQVNTKEVRGVARKAAEELMQEIDHGLIHDAKMLGILEIAENIQEGDVLQVKDGKIIGINPLSFRTRDLFARSAGVNSRYRIQTISESTTLDPLANVVHIDASAGDIVITLYEAAGNEGSYAYLKRIDNVLTNDVTFVTQNGETIDFESLYKLVNQGSGAEVYGDGSNFFIKYNFNDSANNKVTEIDEATYTILTSDNTLAVNYTTTGTVALTLPSAAEAFINGNGIRYLIKDTGAAAGTNNITISRAGSDTIIGVNTGQTSYVMNIDGEAVWVQCKDASTWKIA